MNEYSLRCVCLTPAETRCLAGASQEDRLCDRCRIGEGKGSDGLHWCDRSQAPTLHPYQHAEHTMTVRDRIKWVADSEAATPPVASSPVGGEQHG